MRRLNNGQCYTLSTSTRREHKETRHLAALAMELSLLLQRCNHGQSFLIVIPRNVTSAGRPPDGAQRSSQPQVVPRPVNERIEMSSKTMPLTSAVPYVQLTRTAWRQS